MTKILICANKLLTHDLINSHVPIDMSCVTQKTLPYMPRGQCLLGANKLLTPDLINLHVPINMSCVTQKILPYMLYGRNMIMSSALIYYIYVYMTKFSNRESHVFFPATTIFLFSRRKYYDLREYGSLYSHKCAGTELEN